ncbi:VOC family protein [Psychrobacillus sp. NPDC096426]|uniref:VOC family protein n=1 Tax=Psychrobacillus sp. NPDC096426 TaxID=3364491 RepID=UPI0037F38E58
MKLVKLGYVQLGVKNTEPMINYYKDIMGLSVITEASNGSAYLSSSIDHHNIVLTPSDHPGCMRMGFQLSKDSSLKEAAEQLARHGITSEIKSNVHPGISELLEFTDVVGNMVQLYEEMEYSGVGFKQTGIVPFNFNHVSFQFPLEEQQRAIGFYRDIMGFHITDWVENVITFMTCNSYFHVLNFVVSDHKKMHHLAFELEDWNHMARAHDLLAKKNIPILWGPTRHGAGHPISSYHHDPDGNLVELTFGIDTYNMELGYIEPRPWHEDYPQRPKAWNPDEMLSKWSTPFGFDLVK